MKQKGQGLVEYAIILSFVALVVIAVMKLLGPTIQESSERTSNPAAVAAGEDLERLNNADDLVTSVVRSHYQNECSKDHAVTSAIEKSRSESAYSISYTYSVYENSTLLGDITLVFHKNSSGQIDSSSAVCPATPTLLP